jgi:succinate dehydrogenase / fumarate reductase iron-sulfur subunit
VAWHLTFRVFRYKRDGVPPHFDSFDVECSPDECVIERIWAEQDRGLVFRHACHHGAA